MNKRIASLALAFAATQLGAPAFAQAPAAQFNTCAKPVWPKEALRHEYQGTVTLAFLIGDDGAVRESRVKKSSGHPILDLAAQEGLEKCKFKPGLKDGKPAEAWMQMQYVWTLEGPTPAKMAAALEQARAGAQRGDAAAQNKLGMIYLNAEGVAQDKAEAKKWLQQAADQGQSDAQQTLAMLAMPLDGKGDMTEAMTRFRKAADQGQALSQYFLGAYLLRDGKVAEARDYLGKAARQGHAPAQAMLAQVLLNTGLPADDAEAIVLLEKAATQKERNAQVMLAQRYETGSGVPKDYAQALKLYTEAAAAGNQVAKLALARMHDHGIGVPEDSGKAQTLRREAMGSTVE